MFDSTNRGYYVKPKGQKELTTFVDMVHFVNEDILWSEVDDQAQQDCKNIEHRFWTQTSTTITDKNNGTLEAIITGTSASDDLVTLTCTYEIALGSTRSISLADISVDTSASDEKKQEKAIEPETNEVEAEAKVEVEEETEAEEGREDEVDEANEIGVDEGSGDQWSPDEAIIDEVEAPIEEETIEIEQEEPSPTPGTYADRLSFSSSRGYTMYFSDKGIAYAWAYMTGDAIMNIWWVNCTYGTKVIKRANADSVNTNPDSIIYECVTDWDINTASLPNNTTYIGERGDVHFIKKDFTSALSDMEVGVVR